MTAFTAEDQQQLNDLTYRKAMSDWAERERIRKDKLALVGDLIKVFTAATVQPIVDAARAARPLLAASDPTIADMLGNIETVLGFSGMQVAYFAEQLAIAEPEPVAPSDTSPGAGEQPN